MATKNTATKSNTSKNANRGGAPEAPKKKGAIEISPDMSRIVPTGVDEPHAYVFDIDGKSIHAKVGSEKFFQAISTLVDSSAALRVAARAEELEEVNPGHGWLKAAGILRGTWVEPGEPEVDNGAEVLGGGN
jgi:hypothetical protein